MEAGYRPFVQIKASTREQRAAVRDKAGKEKELLKKRPGNQLVYDTRITEPDPDSIAYAHSNERFQQDYAAHEKHRRVASARRAEDLVTQRRMANAVREEDRWRSIDAQNQREEAKWEAMRDDGEKGQRNNSSVPYNPITLKYNDSQEGEKLKYTDDMIRYRAGIRSNYLFQHGGGDGYDPVTGQKTIGPKVPPKPLWDGGEDAGGGGHGH